MDNGGADVEDDGDDEKMKQSTMRKKKVSRFEAFYVGLENHNKMPRSRSILGQR